MTKEQDQQHPLSQAPHESTGRRASAAKRARALAQKKADAMPTVAAYDGLRRERVVTAELVSPVPDGGVLGVIRQPYMLKLLVRREIASMYSASLLGLLWSYIQPAIRFSVYYLIFGVFLKLHQDVPYFAIHLFAGIVFVHLFSETFSGGTRSIWANRSLVKKMPMPREIFPVAQMVVSAIHTLPQVLLLSVFCLASGWSTDVTGIAAGILGLLIVATFAGALALMFSAVNVYYRDFQNIVGTITQFMHFLVPMMYPFSRIMGYQQDHPVLYQLYLANPVATGVILMQRFFWEGVNKHNGKSNSATVFPPNMLVRGAITLLACLALLYVAQRVFSRLESKFPERL